jgi:hypothetical protein
MNGHKACGTTLFQLIILHNDLLLLLWLLWLLHVCSGVSPLTISCIGQSNIDIRTLKHKWYEFAAVTDGIMFTLELNKIYSEERHEIYDMHV